MVYRQRRRAIKIVPFSDYSVRNNKLCPKWTPIKIQPKSLRNCKAEKADAQIPGECEKNVKQPTKQLVHSNIIRHCCHVLQRLNSHEPKLIDRVAKH
jgi:hypothetical protein